MSSTNRGYNRHKVDYYVTPEQPVRTFLSEFMKDEGFDKDYIYKWNILDPCAGGDENHDMTYPSALFWAGANYDKVTTMDIRADSGARFAEANYLEIPTNNYDMIISNPPFSLAQEFIEKALEEVKEGGYVIFLLRLNFFGSDKRKKLFEKHMPKYCYVHSKRINFIDDKTKEMLIQKGIITEKESKRLGTDSIEYAHFVWQKGMHPDFTKLKVI